MRETMSYPQAVVKAKAIVKALPTGMEYHVCRQGKDQFYVVYKPAVSSVVAAKVYHGNDGQAHVMETANAPKLQLVHGVLTWA